MFLLVFFFSSRRRHTRCALVTSSDVCSSDLASLTVNNSGVVDQISYHHAHMRPRLRGRLFLCAKLIRLPGGFPVSRRNGGDCRPKYRSASFLDRKCVG